MKKINEKQVVDELYATMCQQYNAPQREVVTMLGRIDLLTDDEVIEVKNIRYWKHALGQVLAYKYFYPDKSSRIHLFGLSDKQTNEVIKQVCKLSKVHVTFHSEIATVSRFYNLRRARINLDSVGYTI